MEEKIVPFPKGRARRVIEARKNEGRQTLAALSLVSLILVAVFANELILKTERPIYVVSDNTNFEAVRKLNRAIANAPPANPLRDIEWEHRLARRLGSEPSIEDRTPASFGSAPDAVDEVRWAYLKGKYRVLNKEVDGASKIEAIAYEEGLDSESRPEFIDPTYFLRKYKDALVVQFATFDYQIGNSELGKATFILKDLDQHKVGKALFTLDEEGRFIRLEFSQE